MGKNYNNNMLRMLESIREVVGEDAAIGFEEKYPLSKSADIDKRFAWANNICNHLSENYDDETILKIREKCPCNDGASTATKLIKYLKQSKTTEEFVNKFNEKESFASLEYIDDHKILFCYPQCYCSCVKRINQPLTKTWCYCTVGYAKKVFSKVFHDGVSVHLIESIKSGDKRCAVSIEW